MLGTPSPQKTGEQGAKSKHGTFSRSDSGESIVAEPYSVSREDFIASTGQLAMTEEQRREALEERSKFEAAEKARLEDEVEVTGTTTRAEKVPNVTIE